MVCGRWSRPHTTPTLPDLLRRYNPLYKKEIQMSKRTISIISLFLLALLAATFLTACGSNNSTGVPVPSSGGSSTGQTLMQDRCSVCHSTDRVTSAHKTADEWKTTVDRMISRGAQLSSQEEQTLVDYLALNYK